MSRPLVTLIVPCHNLGSYLEDAVDSIFAQSLRDFEILVVDDGSTDPATCGLLRRYDWPATRVVRLTRHAPAAALAAGLDGAQGHLVGILDPRHALEPTYLEQAVAALAADPSAVLATCWLKTQDGAETVAETSGLVLPDLLAACTVGPAALARRAALLAAGGFDLEFESSGDAEWDLWMRLAEQGARGLVIAQALVRLGPEASAWRVSGGQAAGGRLLDKHADSYTRHALVVIARLAETRRDLHGHGAELAGRVERLARELQRLQGPAQPAAAPPGRPALAPFAPCSNGEEFDRLAQLEAALAEARHDRDELRRSASWRWTAPLRAVHAWLTRWVAPSGESR